MSEVGKSHRLGRIFDRKSGRVVIAALDHGLQHGPSLSGIDRIRGTFSRILEGKPDAVILNPGLVKSIFRGCEGSVGLLVKLTGFTPFHPDFDAVMGSVEEAVSLGADGVSIGFLFGSGYPKQAELMKNLGAIVYACQSFGVPLFVHAYPKGESIPREKWYDTEFVKYAARAASEIGADVVKTSYTGGVESFREAIDACPVPVIQAGGPKTDNDREFLKSVKESIEAGAVGVAIGRNLFMHKRPDAMLGAIKEIVHEDSSVDKAISKLSL